MEQKRQRKIRRKEENKMTEMRKIRLKKTKKTKQRRAMEVKRWKRRDTEREESGRNKNNWREMRRGKKIARKK